MSEKLPVLSGKEIIKALSKVGFVPLRQKGSHVFMRHPTEDGQLFRYTKKSKSTLMDILNQTKLSKNELLKLL